MLGAAPHLDNQYSAFGRIVEGIEVLDAFEKEELEGEAPKRRWRSSRPPWRSEFPIQTDGRDVGVDYHCGARTRPSLHRSL